MVKKREENKNEQDLITCIIHAMQEKMAQEITIIDFSNIQNSVADYFITCHADSPPQMEAIADAVARQTKTQFKSNPYSSEGFENKEWILLDYINIVVHIFREDRRRFYNLEGLWADAKIEIIDNK